MKTKVFFSDNVWKKLKAVKPDSQALLLGFEKDQSLYCIGCSHLDNNWASNIESTNIINQVFGHIPCGIKVIGLYSCSQNEAIRNDCKSFLDCLTAPAELEDFFADPLLLYVWKTNDDNVTTFLYDTESEIISDADIDVGNIDLESELIFMRIVGCLPLCFESNNNFEQTKVNITNAFENLKKKIASSSCTFHLEDTQLLLHNSTDKPYSHVDLTANIECSNLLTYVKSNEDDKKKKHGSLMTPLNLKIIFSTNAKQTSNQNASCVPVIRYERRSFEAISMTISIDMMANILSTLPLSKLPSIFSKGLSCQLDAFCSSIITHYQETGVYYLPQPYHFIVPNCDHLMSTVYPKGVPEKDLESLRKEIHNQFYLPLDKPLMRRSMSYSADNKTKQIYLQNVHIGTRPSGVTNGMLGLVYGSYSYHHYMQDNINDDGWGCAYRSLQTIISWFRHQGYTDKTVPSHVEIQKTLVEIGDKPATFINSRQWIGSMEVGFCLETLLGVTSKFITVSSGTELASKGRELISHFNTQGTPIMIGGGVLAHTILGVDFDCNSGDIKYLVLDPHYTGSEDLLTIQKKGWCGWKGNSFWNKNAYYNLCCPQRPTGI